MIPALFQHGVAPPDYGTYVPLEPAVAIYGGQAVSLDSWKRWGSWPPNNRNGSSASRKPAGFCTYTNLPATVDDLAKVIGYDMPLCPLSIRDSMTPDGRAGREKPAGETGEICFSGPQIFLGYLDDPVNTAKTVSREGICYTGDLGYYDADGLHFAGRSKLVIKPKGYQVFPEDVENHIAGKLKGRVGMVACVGVEHRVWCEAILVFVESWTQTTVPRRVWPPARTSPPLFPPSTRLIVEGQMPLNRVAKTDSLQLKQTAKRRA